MEFEALSKEQILDAKEKYAGVILSDRQVIDLVLGAEKVTLEGAVQWLGVDLPSNQRPFARFSQITKEHFDEFSPIEKFQYLKGASVLVFTGIREAKRFDLSDVYFQVVHFGSGVEGGNYDIQRNALRLNLGQLLSQALEFCNGNVEEARALLKFNDVSSWARKTSNQTRKYTLTDFFDKIQYPDIKEVLVENPNVAKLAFWLSVDIGDFSPRSSSTTFLFEVVFPRADNSIKAEILKYASQMLLSSKAVIMSRFASLLLRNGDGVYKTLKGSNSDSSYVEAFEALQDSVELINLFNQLKGRKSRIETFELVEILEKHPWFLDNISQEGLDDALNATKDHGVALRLERLIKSKKS